MARNFKNELALISSLAATGFWLVRRHRIARALMLLGTGLRLASELLLAGEKTKKINRNRLNQKEKTGANLNLGIRRPRLVE